MIHRKESGQLKAKAGLGIIDNILSTLSNHPISNRACALKFGEIDEKIADIGSISLLVDNGDSGVTYGGTYTTITLSDSIANYRDIAFVWSTTGQGTKPHQCTTINKHIFRTFNDETNKYYLLNIDTGQSGNVGRVIYPMASYVDDTHIKFKSGTGETSVILFAIYGIK